MRAAFSLIELLVVISIIAILASMLLPVIGMVRDAAYKTKCASGMRQIGMAEASYVGDNDGLLTPSWLSGTDVPAAWGYPVNSYFMYWGGPLLGQYIDGFSSASGEVLTGPQLKAVFKCPRDRRATCGTSGRGWETSIGMNVNYAPVNNLRSRQNAITRQSDAVLFIDGGNARWEVVSWAGYPMNTVDDVLHDINGRVWVPWHGGTGANMLFADGHVRFSNNPTAEFLTGVAKAD